MACTWASLSITKLMGAMACRQAGLSITNFWGAVACLQAVLVHTSGHMQNRAHVYVRMYTCACLVYARVRNHTRTCTHKRKYTRMNRIAHARVNMHTHEHACCARIHTRVSACAHVRACSRARTCVVLACTHVRPNAHPHMHTQVTRACACHMSVALACPHVKSAQPCSACKPEGGPFGAQGR